MAPPKAAPPAVVLPKRLSFVEQEEEPAQEVSRGFTYVSAYLTYAVLLLFGHIRDTFGKLLGMGRYFKRAPSPKVSPPGDASMPPPPHWRGATLGRATGAVG